MSSYTPAQEMMMSKFEAVVHALRAYGQEAQADELAAIPPAGPREQISRRAAWILRKRDMMQRSDTGYGTIILPVYAAMDAYLRDGSEK